MKIIETETFILRYPRSHDAIALFDMLEDERVTRYYGSGPLESLNDAHKIMDGYQWANNRKDSFRFIIADPQTDRYIGDVGITHYSRSNNFAELSFKLNPVYWNLGIMSQCLQIALDVCFNELYYHRVQALVISENTPSVRLLEKQGFTQEGILRDYEYVQGRYVDVIVYSYIETDIM